MLSLIFQMRFFYFTFFLFVFIARTKSLYFGAADIFGCMMRKEICLPVHRCTFYFSQMPILPFTDTHLYVYRCRAVELPQACGKAAARQR